MTKSEFQKLQVKAASSGTTLKEFLRSEGVAYSTYNYWCRKLKAEADPMPIAPISIRQSSGSIPESESMSGVELPGVTLAFLNGVRSHFGRIFRPRQRGGAHGSVIANHDVDHVLS